MKVNLINIGRQVINERIEVKDYDELLLEVKKHLMSDNVEIDLDNDTGKGDVILSGFRIVGEIEILRDIDFIKKGED